MNREAIYISFVTSNFKCPCCKRIYKEAFYAKQLKKSNKYFIYKFCRYSKKKMGISINYMGNVVVWLKEKEKEKESKSVNNLK